MKGKKKEGLALVISIGHSPKKPTDTATPDMPKKAGYGDGKLKGRMTPILSSIIKELLEKARGVIPGTQGPPLGGKGPQLRQKTKCTECGGRLAMDSAPGADGAEELTCQTCGLIEPDPYDVVPDIGGGEGVETIVNPSAVRDDDIRRGTPMGIAFRLLKARYASVNDDHIDISQWPYEEAVTGAIKKPRNLGKPLDSEPMAADWLTRTQDEEVYDPHAENNVDEMNMPVHRAPGIGEMREMRDIDEQRGQGLQDLEGTRSQDEEASALLQQLVEEGLLPESALEEGLETQVNRGNLVRRGNPMDMAFRLLKALTNDMALPTEQEMRFVRENLESGDPERAAHAQIILDRIQSHPTTQAMAGEDYANENPDIDESNLYDFINQMQSRPNRNRGGDGILNAEDILSPLDLAMDFLRK